MHCFAGKILRVNLSDSITDILPTEAYTGGYLGGRGIASKIYRETVKPETGAFDPENRLIFMNGALVATGAQGATRMTIVAKSPMALPEGFCYGNIGGFFGPELKNAGFDGIVIEGKAEKPVYLWIKNDKVRILDAAPLWGQGAYRSGEILQKTHGERVRFLTTGVAGERIVRTAILFASHESTATGGFGAVMGSKNLKAIAVIGTGKPSVADPEGLKNLNRYIIQISKRYWAMPPRVVSTGKSDLLEITRKSQCYRCGMQCFKGIYRYGKRLEGLRRCQAMEYYLPWTFSRDDEPLETFFDAPILANDYSICTFELQGIIDWLYDSYREGILTEKETGLPLSKIGTREFLEKLCHCIAYREGIGDILAEGLVRGIDGMPDKARALMSPAMAPIGSHDLAPPRAFVAHALVYPMEPRIHQPIIHEMSTVRMAWMAHRLNPELSPVDNKVFHGVAGAFWGSEAAGDLSGYEGKALAAKNVQNRTYIKDSLGLCDPAWPITYSFNTPDHVGDPDLEARLYTAITGIDSEETERCADRIANLQRDILIREGRRLPEADFPPEFNFTEPLMTRIRGQKVLMPGPGDEVVDATGKTLDREKFKELLREYYHIRGWDEDTGRLSAEVPDSSGESDPVPG
jgi:aldehyde:ferredoxin oxidoreductase